jgi:integrase
MPIVALTKRKVETLKFDGKQKLYRDSNTQGFAVRVSKRSKTYIVVKNHREILVGRTDILDLDAARTKAVQILANVTLGEPLPARQLGFHDYLDEWIIRNASSHSKYTADTNRTCLNRYVKRNSSNIPLPLVTSLYVGQVLESVRAKHSSRSAQKVYSLLRKALGDANADGLLAGNPCGSIRKPRHKPQPITPLTAEQSKQFLEAAKDDRFYPIYVLALTTGMRLGELLGLKWGDLHGDVIQVQRALHEIAGKKEIGDVKTKSSRRSVKLTAYALAVLEEHQRHSGGEFIFSSPDGHMVTASNLRGRSFYRILRKAKLPRIRFHDLRHTAATLMLLNGVHPKIVQEILGHSSIQTTLDTYSHALPTMQGEAVTKMDQFFGGSL